MKRPSATLIGTFVLGALGLIVAAILFFGGGALFTQRFTAVSYFPDRWRDCRRALPSATAVYAWVR